VDLHQAGPAPISLDGLVLRRPEGQGEESGVLLLSGCVYPNFSAVRHEARTLSDEDLTKGPNARITRTGGPNWMGELRCRRTRKNTAGCGFRAGTLRSTVACVEITPVDADDCTSISSAESFECATARRFALAYIGTSSMERLAGEKISDHGYQPPRWSDSGDRLREDGLRIHGHQAEILPRICPTGRSIAWLTIHCHNPWDGGRRSVSRGMKRTNQLSRTRIATRSSAFFPAC